MGITTGTTTVDDGTAIAWDRRGSGAPLVLVHGITNHRGLMAPLAERLAATHDVISIDQRGHGASERGEALGIDRLAADVALVCADLGLDAPMLVGHSLGGLAVTAAGAAAGARAVVNIDQILALGAMAEMVASIAPMLTDPATFHATLAQVFAALDSPALDDTTRAEVDRCVAEADQDVVLGIWAPMLAGPDPAVDGLVEALLSTVTMPYLVIHGSDPGPEYTAWLAGHVAGLELDVHDGEGHFLHLVHPDRTAARIAAFDPAT